MPITHDHGTGRSCPDKRCGPCAGCGRTLYGGHSALPIGQRRCWDCRREDPAIRGSCKIYPRDCRRCGALFIARESDWVRCAPCRANGRYPLRDSVLEGYGQEHKQERAAAFATFVDGVTLCARCEQPMRRSESLHLDHADDRSGYIGLSHASCNVRASHVSRYHPGKPCQPKPEPSCAQCGASIACPDRYCAACRLARSVRRDIRALITRARRRAQPWVQNPIRQCACGADIFTQRSVRCHACLDALAEEAAALRSAGTGWQVICDRLGYTAGPGALYGIIERHRQCISAGQTVEET